MDKHLTQKLTDLDRFTQPSTEDVLVTVYNALKEKGYNPVNQIVGYILSGDPTYITSHGGARVLICKIERDELLERLVLSYLKEKGIK